jgi:Holliday junction DNA helicase RuvA
MIASLTGTLTAKSPTEVLLDVGGIGYAISIPLSTFNVLASVNERVTLFTHLHVREDAFQLFGFATAEDRDLFRLLISVSGIGPKIGQGLLSGMSTEELRANISGGRIDALTAIPGVGRKTAERLILELRDKISKVAAESSPIHGPGPTPADVRTETLLALTSLGYSRPAAEKAIRAVLNEATAKVFSVEELLKQVLKKL